MSTQGLPQSVTAELQSLSPDAIIELFELDLSALDPTLPNPIVCYHAGTNGVGKEIVWNNVTYYPFPVTVSGYEYNGQGQLPRPKMQVSNIASTISAMVLAYGDLVGAKVTRRRTFAKYLDAQNFPDGNPDADPTAEFPPDIYFIDQRTAENRNTVEFTLAAAFDFQGVTLPRRVIVQNVCAWTYRTRNAQNTGFDYTKASCPYNRETPDTSVTPARKAFFDANDISTDDPASDVCGKRLSSCRARYGTAVGLPYGAFPASSLTNN